MKNYELLEETQDGKILIKLTSGDFSGIIFSYGGVSFEDMGDHAVMHFDYDVVNSESYDKEAFGKYVGDILMDIISEQLAKNEIVYTGGIDENRTTDPKQPDF